MTDCPGPRKETNGGRNVTRGAWRAKQLHPFDPFAASFEEPLCGLYTIQREPPKPTLKLFLAPWMQGLCSNRKKGEGDPPLPPSSAWVRRKSPEEKNWIS